MILNGEGRKAKSGENKLELHKKCVKKDVYNVIIPSEGTKMLVFNQY